jgi:hypothetical protein
MPKMLKRSMKSRPADRVQTLQRQEFDRMAEEAGKEADRHFEEQAAKQAQEEEAERQQQKVEEQGKRVEEELARLSMEIEEIKKRGLGPSYTIGMRENQIKLVQEKIDLLKGDPEAYFK